MRECPTEGLHIYRPYKEAIEERVRFTAVQPSTAADEFADKVVKVRVRVRWIPG